MVAANGPDYGLLMLGLGLIAMGLGFLYLEGKTRPRRHHATGRLKQALPAGAFETPAPARGESPRARPTGAASGPRAPAPQAQRARNATSAAAQAQPRAQDAAVTRPSAAIPEDALRHADRYVRARYAAFVASAAAVLLLTVIAGGVLIGSLLGSSDWERGAIAGSAAAASVILLVLLQYGPATSLGSASLHLVRLEASRVQLNHCFALWECYWDEPPEAGRTADDIDAGGSPLTAAARELA